MKNPDMDFTTAPTQWTDKDTDIIVDYLIHKKLGLKNVKELSID